MCTKELINKYKRNELTHEELITLRQKLSQLPSLNMEDLMLYELQHDEIAIEEHDQPIIQKIRENLQNELWPAKPSPKQSILNKLLRIAAIITIPLLIFSTVYLYYENRSIGNSTILLQTAPGERVSVILPDGTQVNLNSESQLSYRPAEFNKQSRKLEFKGEAFFNVAKNRNVPFEIISEKLKLQVLGTKFNYSSYPNLDYIEVKLIEGHVMLSSSLEHGDKAELFNQEIGRFNKHTGKITVTKLHKKVQIPWLNHNMIFESAPLDRVFETIERCYDIRIHADSLLKQYETFTGLLPTNNYEEVIQTLHKCFNIKSFRLNKDIYLTVK